MAAADADAPALGPRRHPVHDAVLDQRLQAERRDLVLQRGRVDLPADVEPGAEAQAFQGEVVAHELHLVGQGHAVGGAALAVEHVAQHAREAQERGLGRARVLAGQRDERVEGVEQEVRIELAADRRQLGARQRRLGLGRRQRGRAGTARLQHGGEAGGRGRVDHQPPDGPPGQRAQQHRPGMVGAEEQPRGDELAHLPQRAEQQRRRRVEGQRGGGTQGAPLHPSHPREDGGAEQHRRPQAERGLVRRLPERPQAALQLGAGQQVEQPGEHAGAAVGQPHLTLGAGVGARVGGAVRRHGAHLKDAPGARCRVATNRRTVCTSCRLRARGLPSGGAAGTPELSCPAPRAPGSGPLL